MKSITPARPPLRPVPTTELDEEIVEFIPVEERITHRVVFPKWFVFLAIAIPVLGTAFAGITLFGMPKQFSKVWGVVTSTYDAVAKIGSDVQAIKRGQETLLAREEPKSNGDLEKVVAKVLAEKLDERLVRFEKNDPRIVRLEAENKAKEKMIGDLQKKRLSAEEEARKAKEEKQALAEALDVTQQKLEQATSQTDVDEIMKDAVAHLPREDVEALMLMEKINVRESSGRPRVLGPWVKVYTLERVGKKSVRRLKRRSEANPWNKVEWGVVYDRAHGPSQMMGDNIPDWSEEATGIRYTPDQLMKNMVDYRRTVIHRLKKLLAMYNHDPRDVISVWHSGQPFKRAVKNGSRDVNMTTEAYTDLVRNADPLDKRVLRNAREGETKN